MHLVWRMEIFRNLSPKHPAQDQINKRHRQDAHGTSRNQRPPADVFLLSKTKKRGLHAVRQKNSNHSCDGVPIHKGSRLRWRKCPRDDRCDEEREYPHQYRTDAVERCLS